MTPLVGLTSLFYALSLFDTQVSDVKPLAGLARLRLLNLNGTQVSQEDYEMLEKALPNCEVIWSPTVESR